SRIGVGSAGAAGTGEDLVLVLRKLKAVLNRVTAVDVLQTGRSFPAITVLIGNQAKSITRVISDQRSAIAAVDERNNQRVQITCGPGRGCKRYRYYCAGTSHGKVVEIKRRVCHTGHGDRVRALQVQAEHELTDPRRRNGRIQTCRVVVTTGFDRAPEAVQVGAETIVRNARVNPEQETFLLREVAEG